MLISISQLNKWEERINNKKNIYIFDKNNILQKKISLPIKEHVKGFDYIYHEGKELKVFFNTNDTYDYKATLNEDTFEFSDWGVTK